MRRFLVPLSFVLATLPSAAYADDPAAAEVLFREGRTLMGEGKTEAARQKFKASQALDPSPGTLLNMAACDRSLGRTASAWAEFLSAARLAHAQQKRQQESEASRRAAELEPTLSYLTIRVLEPVPGIEVRRSETRLEPSLYGMRVPVDPGDYSVDANANGYEVYHANVHVKDARDEAVVEIPKLVPKAAGGSVAVPTPPAQADSARSPTAGDASPPRAVSKSTAPTALPWVVAGIGGALLVGGGVSGVLALKSNSAAKDHCPDAKHCTDPEALSLARRRDTEAVIADVGIGVGLAAIGAAVILGVTQRGNREQNASFGLIPELSTERAGLSFWERF
jgi:hypothetical protein